ncbi:MULTISPECIES: L,D-transpeptidase [Sphingobacterium]|uniref:L,D-transpeptidase n=1 Tax=Sphingobacterium TaxID=28453 RepID=UPI0013D9902C|nr:MULTISPECIES: L,D-transpeptidase [unclassified Sphingobacterium]
MIKTISKLSIITAVLFSTSCGERPSKNDDKQEKQAEKDSTHVLISISQRQLYVLEGTDTLKKYPIAVGKDGHPTPEGDFQIHQIDWNPDWTPPESEWAKSENYKKPGEEGNPMGRARIVYQMPYTIHGTKDIQSLGNAESHGSVRMANSDVIELGKLLMQKSGTEKSDDWFKGVLNDSTKMESVKLEKHISLKNVQ